MNRVGEFAIHKRKVPRDVFTCDANMLMEPPGDLGESYRYKTRGDSEGKSRDNEVITEREMKRTAFNICRFTEVVNGAAEYFKREHCVGGGNFEKTWKQDLH